jgi:hypothetical protein
VKYAAPWKEEWIVVEGEWGRTAFIGGYEYPVPTQFTVRDKWAKGVLAPESREILARIMKRGYTNMQYPTLDPFEGARVERYLRISLALPGELTVSYSLLFAYIFSLFFCFSLSIFPFCSVCYPDGSGVSFFYWGRGYDSASSFPPLFLLLPLLPRLRRGPSEWEPTPTLLLLPQKRLLLLQRGLRPRLPFPLLLHRVQRFRRCWLGRLRPEVLGGRHRRRLPLQQRLPLLLLLLQLFLRTLRESWWRKQLSTSLPLLLLLLLDRGQGVLPLTRWYPDSRPHALVEV